MKSYIKKFTPAFAVIKDSNESFAIQEFRAGVVSEHVHYALCNRDITIMHKLVSHASHAQSLVKAEEMRLSHTSRIKPQEQKDISPAV